MSDDLYPTRLGLILMPHGDSAGNMTMEAFALADYIPSTQTEPPPQNISHDTLLEIAMPIGSRLITLGFICDGSRKAILLPQGPGVLVGVGSKDQIIFCLPEMVFQVAYEVAR